MSDMVVNQEDFLARRLIYLLKWTSGSVVFSFMLAQIVVCMHLHV